MPAFPPNPQTGAEPVQPAGPTFAAGLMLVLIVVGATLSVGSAYLLWRGEKHDAALLALPTTCAAVVLLDKPAAAPAALERAVQGRVLPTELEAGLRLLQPLATKLAALPELREESAAVCFGADGLLVAIPTTAPAAVAAAEAALAELAPGAPPAGRSTGEVLILASTALRLPGMPTPTGATADTLVAQAVQRAAPPAEGREPPQRLPDDLLFREAIERVGPGQVHVYVSPQAAQGLLGPRIPPAWQSGLALAQWFGVGVLARDEDVRVHLQFGANQQGAVWLKEHFDFALDLEAAVAWPAQSELTGMVRAGREGWPLLQAAVPPLDQLLAQFPSPDNAAIQLWRKALSGQVAWSMRGGCLVSVVVPNAGADVRGWLAPEAGGRCAAARKQVQLGEQRVVVTAPAAELEAVAAELVAGKNRAEGLDGDGQRLSSETQGWRRWNRAGQEPPAQMDWIWLDRGLAAGWTIRDPQPK